MCCGCCRAVTFRLCLLTVGRDDDALQLPELQVFQDLPQPQHEPAFCLGLDGILLVHPVLEAHQFLEQTRDTSIYFFTKHLAAVAERNPGTGDADSIRQKPQRHQHSPGPCTSLYHRGECHGRPCPACLVQALSGFSSMCHPALNVGTWTGCPEEPCERGGMSTVDCSYPGELH